MAKLGDVMVEVGADIKEFTRAMNEIEGNTRKVTGTISNNFSSMEKSLYRYYNQSAKNLKNLPEHLKPFATSLDETRKNIKLMSRESTQSIEEMAKSVTKTRVGFDKLTSATSSGKQAVKVMQELADETKKTRLAVMGLNEDGTVTLSTDESTKQLKKFQNYVASTKLKLEAMRDAGDMGSYAAGMKQLEYEMRKVDKAMQAVAKGGNAYLSELEKMGIITEAMGNRTVVAMERMKESFIHANDVFQARTTQSTRIMDNLARMDVRGLDQQFLKLGNRLEKMAKQGTATNVALKELGRGASMSDIQKQVQMINQGIMRMQMLSVASTVAFGGLAYVLIKASVGASVSEVRQQQAEITSIYKQEIEKRASEIYNFAGLFEKVEIGKFNSQTLISNLQGQVNIMKNWMANLKTLAKRGVDEGLIAELEKLGPASAGQIQAMASMSDAELTKYVGLWKEKHKLAREQSVSELEYLKEETKKQIAELEDSLKPLGISLEKAKGTWAKALQPFIDSFSRVASVVVDGFTAVGEFIIKLNEMNPAISTTIGWFVLLVSALIPLLSPLAIGISRAGSFAVAFNTLWMVIGPLVTGFLAVIGTVALVAAAIIAGTLAIKEMWEHSETLRSTVASVWETIKGAIMSAVAVIVGKWNELKSEIDNLLQKVTGGTSTMGDLWRILGDVLAVVIQNISKVVLPILTGAIQIAGDIVAGVIDAMIIVVKWMADKWAKHGSDITDTIKKLWGYIEQAFGSVQAFLAVTMPKVSEIVSKAFELIEKTITFVLDKIVPTVVNGFQWIWDKIDWIMPIVLFIIKDTWESIQSIIDSVLSIITNIIDLFINILEGNWEGAWENVKNILLSAVTLLWEWVQLWILGKVLGIFKGLGKNLTDALSDVAEKIKKPFKDGYDKVMDTLDELVTQGKKKFGDLKQGITDKLSDMKDKILKPFSDAWDEIKKIPDKIKNAFDFDLKLPDIKLPKINIGTKKDALFGFDLPTFSISWNAKGNIFKGASLLGGGQGVGEAGAEVVMPIERKRYMKPYASMVSDLLGKDMKDGYGEGIVQNITINSPEPLSPSDIARKNLQVSRRLAREWGL